MPADNQYKQRNRPFVIKWGTNMPASREQTERMDVTMPKKTQEQEQAPKTKADTYAKINMPAAFLTPHTIETKDGHQFEKCFVSFPKGTKVNGIDVGGFSADVFLSDYMKKDMLEKGRATVSFKKDEPVPIWTGKKGDEQHPYQRYEVKATDLTHALKVAQDSYKAEKAAERAAAKDGVSLAGEARDMETGKDALAGDDPAKSTKSRTGQDIAQ